MRTLVVCALLLAIPAPALWTDHWNGLDKLASNWLQDLDSNLCKKTGNVLGVPMLPDSCKRGPRDAKLMVPFESASAECTRQLEDEKRRGELLTSMLKKEQVMTSQQKRQMLVSKRQAKQAKQTKSNSARQMRQAMNESAHVMLRFDSMAQELRAMALQIRQQEDECKSVQDEVEKLRSDDSKIMCPVPPPPLLSSTPVFFGLVIVPIAVGIFMVLMLKRSRTGHTELEKQMRHKTLELEKQMRHKTLELVKRISQLPNVREEVNADPVRGVSDNFDSDFSCHVFDDFTGRDTVRSIKIKCPGVYHNDVVVDVMFSGCIITINRKAAQGVDAFEWRKEFQFKASDGLFDLKDHQVTLDGGFLTLVFQALQNRVFCFPQHFDMSADDAWLNCYTGDCAPSRRNDASLNLSLAGASQALRMASGTDFGNRMPSNPGVSGMLEQIEESDVTGKAPIMTTTCATASSSDDFHNTAASSAMKMRCATACEASMDNQSTSPGNEGVAKDSPFHREGIIKGSLTIPVAELRR